MIEREEPPSDDQLRELAEQYRAQYPEEFQTDEEAAVADADRIVQSHSKVTALLEILGMALEAIGGLHGSPETPIATYADESRGKKNGEKKK